MKIKLHTIAKRFVELVELEDNEKTDDRVATLRKEGFEILYIWQPHPSEQPNIWEITYRKFLRLPKDVKKA